MKKLCFSVAVLIWLIGTPASAHHSRAGFDTDSIEAYQGTITTFSWTNPHVYITVELADGDGD